MRDIVAHVRDRNDQPIAALAAPALRRERLGVDRIVEVLRRLTVDRHERQIAQVDTSVAVDIRDAAGKERALPLDFTRKDVRQIVLPERDLDLHARIGVVAEHLDHACDRLHVLRRLNHHLDGHDLPGRGAGALAGRNEEIAADALVFRHDDQHAMLVADAADDAPLDALDHFHDLAFGTPAPVHAEMRPMTRSP